MFEEVARIAERGLLDIVCSGDGTGTPDTWRGNRDAAVEWGVNWPRQDLQPNAVAMARETKHVGFGLTYSTTFHAPVLHRPFDEHAGPHHRRAHRDEHGHLDPSLGLREFRHGGPDGPRRPLRPDEGVRRCLRLLWDSAELDAMVCDRETGQVGDPAKVHDVRHAGKHLTSRDR